VAPSKQERDAREARERLRVYSARQQVHGDRISRRRRDNIIAIAGVLVIVGLVAATQYFWFTAGPGAPAADPSPSASPSADAGENIGDVPDPATAEGRDWTGTLTLNDIPLDFTLDGAAAPQSVAVFVQSVQQNYYPGKTCHRLTDGEGFGVLQCGSLDGQGSSDPDFAYGPIENAPADGVYPAGTIAVARGADGYSQGRQFFICYTDTTLPTDTGGYTIIGTVTAGLDQLGSEVVAGGLTPVSGENDGTPNVPTTITAVTVE
jgi:peptidyl-prolyl cis-trans isomerase B (cyclophilin B)